MIKTLILFVFTLVVLSTAQDPIANYVYSSVTTFCTVSEIECVENKIATQFCGGATAQDVFDNFVQTLSECIGMQTLSVALSYLSKVKNDLGDDFDAVRQACADAAAQTADPVIADTTQYCGSGNAAVLAQAANYANQQFGQSLFNNAYQAIGAINPNDWTICRNDLANVIMFQNFGY
ncbi:hypothetical protein L596_030567 [Steinernema carpocapsae]|uniref:Saposin B-type domain-containing protein n=1 Tax=Steinernema carpocapsae TaxID=34508 RepID=A0A4U5LPR4_STECR|nr:hypothetical protein L596_030567 [Steinernema carpocapsae]